MPTSNPVEKPGPRPRAALHDLLFADYQSLANEGPGGKRA